MANDPTGNRILEANISISGTSVKYFQGSPRGISGVEPAWHEP